MTRMTIAAALLVLLAGPALAHSFPKTAQPAAGSTVKNAPSDVVILFTEALEPKFSSLQVFDSRNHEVDTGNAHADPNDAKRFSVNLKPLSPGTYKVVWHATSVDTHKTQGSYTFTVAP